ncbi:MAG: amidohydrolase [Deltaproteobacteria bacterium]|jgi:predicted TIM-barrel fold metal-dependent hydrolase|nr:amidohydrolase [Deltaproteobacteria bacterium]
MTAFDVNRLGYRFFDCDNHMYEPRDSFTRYIEPRFRDRAVRPVKHGGTEIVMVGDQPMTFMEGYELYDRVGRPGSLKEMLHQMKSGIVNEGDYEWEPPRKEYLDRDTRLALMDEQGIEACLLFPSVAGVVEHFFRDTATLYANFRAFNRWLEETWGFAYQDRIFALPSLSLRDLDRAVEELDRVLSKGARAITLRAAPIGGRAPSDPYFDPFWARLDEAKATVALHLTESGYNELVSTQWGEAANPPNFGMSAWQWTNCYGDRPIMDTLSAFVFDGLFGAFPNLKVVSVENGAEWVPYLVRRMDKMKGMGRNGPWKRGRLRERPSEIWNRHVSVTPYPEDDVPAIVAAVGPDSIVMGSDWPHPEGLKNPADFADLVTPLPADQQRQILRDNGFALVAG